MTLLEALLRDVPDFVVLNPAEPVGVSSPVVGLGCPEHLGRLASGPGGEVGAAKEALVVVVQS